MKKKNISIILASVVPAVCLSAAIYFFIKNERDLAVIFIKLCVDFIQLYIELKKLEKDLDDEES